MTAELAPAADECLRWRHGRLHGWRHVHEGGFNRHDYLVGPVAYTEARTFTTERHYSASWPSVRLRYGLWHMATRHGLPELVGVAALSVPPRKEVLTNVFPGLQAYYQTLELGRFLMDISVPGNGESFFLGEMLRLAALDGIRGLVSFADPMPRYTAAGRLIFPGHRGTSYQAGNAIYTGRATAGNITLLPDATVLSRRTAQKIRRGEPGWRAAEQLLVASGATPRQPGRTAPPGLPPPAARSAASSSIQATTAISSSRAPKRRRGGYGSRQTASPTPRIRGTPRSVPP